MGNGVHHLLNDFGAVFGVRNPDTGVERLVRNEAGDVVERVRQDSGSTRYTRDAAGRAVQRVGSDGLIDRWIYDQVTGRLSEMSNEGSLERFTYNANADLVSHQREMDGRTFQTRFTYNELGLLSEKTLPDGQVLEFSYHEEGLARGSLKTIARRHTFGILQEPVISDIDIEWRDGKGGWLSHNGQRTDVTYSARGDMLKISVDGLSELEYRYDDRDRLSQIEHDGNISDLEYEGARLVAAKNSLGSFLYQYDAAGNRVSETRQSANDAQSQTLYTYATDEEPGSGNRLLASTDALSGERQQRSYTDGGSPIDDGVHGYVYDTERRPIQVYRGDFLLAEYRYNASGERVRKVVHDISGEYKTTYFLYDDAQLSAEISADSEVAKQFIYLQRHRPVALLEGDELYAIHSDHLGTPHAMTDSNGVTAWKAVYEPFGRAVLALENVRLPLRLPGQYFDNETGSHYNYFRDYDPDTGRYLTADPIGMNGGLHHYAYANGLPLSEIDPLGLRARPVRNFTTPGIQGVMARLNARQLIETIQTYQPSYIYATHSSLPRSPFDVADVVHLAMTLQSYQLRDAIRDFDSAFDFYPTGMPQQVNELARRLDAMTYIEQIRQTQDPNYSYPREDYSEADLDFLSDLAISGGSECTAFYDADFANYFDAQQLEVFIGDGVANGALALDENGDWYVPLSEVDELAYGDYTASGGTLSRADWEIAGKPANVLAEGMPEATPNSDGSFNRSFGITRFVFKVIECFNGMT